MAKRTMPKSGSRLRGEVLEDRHLLAVCTDGGAAGAAPAPSEMIPGDINDNGSVDFEDFLILSNNFGEQVEPYTLGDIDGDGTVGFPDFLVVSHNFGQEPVLSHGANNLNTMRCKLDEAIGMLDNNWGRWNEPVIEEAIDTIIEAVTTSNIVPLPSPDDPATQNDNEAILTEQIHEEWNQMVRDAAEALKRHVVPIPRGTAETRGEALEALNFLELLQEATHQIGDTIQQCGLLPQQIEQLPGGQRQPACELLLQGDEGGQNIVDTVFGGLYHRQIRSPFPLLNLSTTATIQEQVIVPDGPIGPGEASVVAKEVQGIKAVVTARQIPIWAEPWTSRARIIGFSTVYVLEFVPAEWIKTITFLNRDGTGIETQVSTTVVIERELLHFWRFLEKEITPVS